MNFLWPFVMNCHLQLNRTNLSSDENCANVKSNEWKKSLGYCLRSVGFGDIALGKGDYGFLSVL